MVGLISRRLLLLAVVALVDDAKGLNVPAIEVVRLSPCVARLSVLRLVLCAA